MFHLLFILWLPSDGFVQWELRPTEAGVLMRSDGLEQNNNDLCLLPVSMLGLSESLQDRN